MSEASAIPADTAVARKSRGAFFTPDRIAQFLVEWAVRDQGDSVLEPSCGDAAFLVPVVDRLRRLGNPEPEVAGVEIHPASAEEARARIAAVGGRPRVEVSDFFAVEARDIYHAVVGNPPFIRYQDFSGTARVRARASALRAGVSLSGLASSWAAFVVHSTQFLRRDGRLALVLPAELLSVNYAAAVRAFLFRSFEAIDLVTFTQRVFPEAETEVVLLMASGYANGPTDHATIYQADSELELGGLLASSKWAPASTSSKWTPSLHTDLPDAYADLGSVGFSDLSDWGSTTLGMVTGSNRYFALSPSRVRELALSRSDVVPLSPPGSSHLRSLQFERSDWARLGREGKASWLFRPPKEPSTAARGYIAAGEKAGIQDAYKCRIRKPWWRVPRLEPADLLLTYMNAATPMLSANLAGVHHLNSVHGVYLQPELKEVGALLPLAALNSASMLSAELVGRSYGGGILKLEPKEADVWAVPSALLVESLRDKLTGILPHVRRHLAAQDLSSAVALVDAVVLEPNLAKTEVVALRSAYSKLAQRRKARSQSGR